MTCRFSGAGAREKEERKDEEFSGALGGDYELDCCRRKPISRSGEVEDGEASRESGGCDPEELLKHSTTPTLFLFLPRDPDRNVDIYAARKQRRDAQVRPQGESLRAMIFCLDELDSRPLESALTLVGITGRQGGR